MALRPALSNNKKRKIQRLLAEAFRALQQGEHEACERHCNAILLIQAGNADAAYIRGIMARDAGNHELAEEHFKSAVASNPKQADFSAALAGLYLANGDYPHAISRYRATLALDAYNIHAHLGMAGAYVRMACYDEAIALLEAAKKRKPGMLDIHMGLFQACHESGRHTQAREHLNNVLKRAPQHAQALYSLALLEVEQGALEPGEQTIRQALASDPDYAEAYTVLADLRRFTQSHDDDLIAMQACYARYPADSPPRMHMAFTLAKAYDDLARACQGKAATKHYDHAFQLLQEANSIRHRFSHYDATPALEQMQQLIEHCSTDVIAHHSGLDDASAIFVLGMPRSGTTLVEQILAAHPDVHSCGENALLCDAIRAVSGAEKTDAVAITHWSGQQCLETATHYLEQVQQHAPNARRFTDKSLNLITHIGSIARFLPQARIIHVRRNHLDTCLSIYKNNLIGSLFDYGHDLTELGRYYRAYERLMAHWKSILPASMFIEIDYEDLVAAPEAQSKTLLAACELNWHPACLDFHHADTHVQSASMTQVRQPIYQRSVGSANHYRKHLQPLVDALERCPEPA